MSVINSHNAARDLVTVYSPDGEAKQYSRLNARELVTHQGWTFGKKDSTAPAPEPVAEIVEEPVVEEPVVVPPAVEEPKVDHINDPLANIAFAIAGNDDVEKYLTGFPVEDLRIMAEQRYGEKIHARTGKEKVIEKIISLEAEALAKLND